MSCILEPGWAWHDVVRLHTRGAHALVASLRGVRALLFAEKADHASAEAAAILARHLPPSHVHLVPGSRINAVAVLYALVDALVEDPEAMMVIAGPPACGGTSALDDALSIALPWAAANEAIVVGGAEPDLETWTGAWIEPYEAPICSPMVAVVRLVFRAPARVVDTAMLRCTGLVIAHGRKLLESYERMLPRLVRACIFDAENERPPCPPRELPQLDLHAEVLAFVHGLGCYVLGRRPSSMRNGQLRRLPPSARRVHLVS